MMCPFSQDIYDENVFMGLILLRKFSYDKILMLSCVIRFGLMVEFVLLAIGLYFLSWDGSCMVRRRLLAYSLVCNHGYINSSICKCSIHLHAMSKIKFKWVVDYC